MGGGIIHLYQGLNERAVPMETISFITPNLAAVHSLNHHYKVVPEGLNRLNQPLVRIYDRQMEVPLFQFHMVYHQTTIFHMEDFHAGTIRVDEDEGVTVSYILPHQVGHDTAKHIKTLTSGWVFAGGLTGGADSRDFSLWERLTCPLLFTFAGIKPPLRNSLERHS